MRGRQLFLISILILFWQLTIYSQNKPKIAVIPKSETAAFWKSVHTGARLGAVAFNVEVEWKAPTKDDDVEQQVKFIEESISQKVSGIVIAPLDKKVLLEPVTKAMNNNIPVIIFDSRIEGKAGKNYVSFVGIDNKKAGKLAAEEMLKLMKGKNRIIVLRYSFSVSNISAREEGFIETMSKQNNIILDKDNYIGGSIDEVINSCMKLEDKLKSANGVFCSYEHATLAMLTVLRRINMIGKIRFVGFDTPNIAIEALKNGEIDVLIAQDPSQIGFQCLKTIVDYIRGKSIRPNVDIPVKIVTRKNLNEPEIQKILALPSD